jgi:hypothetical protein
MLATKTFKPAALFLALVLLMFSAMPARAGDSADKASNKANGDFLASVTDVANDNTVPAKGDENPYGVAVVNKSKGSLKAGSILVSNFNNSMNQQGTGTTIVEIDKKGNQTLFFQGSGLGLTTALGVLPQGVVAVGNVPTTDGSSDTVMQGSLLLLGPTGQVLATLTDPKLLDGPWDLTVQNKGHNSLVFVSNVLSGTVTRIKISVKKSVPTVVSMTQIGSGYAHRTDPNALVVGPTGLVFDPASKLLYVASTGDNEVFSIPDADKTTADAGTGTVVYTDSTHLHGPLAMGLAPNGHLLATQGDAVNPDPTHNSEIVEFTKAGVFVDEKHIDPAVGAAFGFVVSKGDLIAVDDGNNTLVTYAPQNKGKMGGM